MFSLWKTETNYISCGLVCFRANTTWTNSVLTVLFFEERENESLQFLYLTKPNYIKKPVKL